MLNEKGIQYKEIDLSDKPDELDALKKRTGLRTVPQIFIKGQLVGGFTELADLDSTGELERLVNVP